MNPNKPKTEDATPDTANSTGERPRGGVSPHAGENENTPGIGPKHGDDGRSTAPGRQATPSPGPTVPDAPIGDNS